VELVYLADLVVAVLRILELTVSACPIESLLRVEVVDHMSRVDAQTQSQVVTVEMSVQQGRLHHLVAAFLVGAPL
jgi:hypothetical protein